MQLSLPGSPSSPLTAASLFPSATATSPTPRVPTAHFAAYHSFHRDLCRHAAALPRQLSDHFTQLSTLRSTSRTFSSHLSRLLCPPPSASSTSVLRHFSGVTELVRVALLQQLDTALTMLVECVGVLGSGVESMARLSDSLRGAATTVDVQLLSMDAAAVREWERIEASASEGSPSKVSASSITGGSHRKQNSNKKQPHTEARQAADDDLGPSLTAAVSPLVLLLTLEDIVHILTALHQQHRAALAQLQAATKGGGEKLEVGMQEALNVLSASGNVDVSTLEDWLSIIRRACKV